MEQKSTIIALTFSLKRGPSAATFIRNRAALFGLAMILYNAWRVSSHKLAFLLWYLAPVSPVNFDTKRKAKSHANW